MHHTRKNRIHKKSKGLKNKSKKSKKNSKKSRKVNKRRIRGGGKLSKDAFEQITTDIQKTQDNNGNPIPINDRVNAFIEATQHIEACDSMFSRKTDVKCGQNKFATYGHRWELGKELIEELGPVKRNNRVLLIAKNEEWGELAQKKWNKLEKGKSQKPNAEEKEDADENANNILFIEEEDEKE